MTKQKKYALGVVLIIFMALVAGGNPAFAALFGNHAGSGYDESPPPDGAAANGNHQSIDDYIIKGAGFYLKASKDVNALLRMVELQNHHGVSVEELKALADRAIANMTHALGASHRLVEKAEATPYNMEVIHRLKGLNYHSYMQEKKLNPVVFEEVAGYLNNGDITGVFKKRVAVYTKILGLLNAVKNQLDQNNLPKLPDLWKLNETFSLSSMFESYVARIFQFLIVKDRAKSSSSSSLEVKNVR